MTLGIRRVTARAVLAIILYIGTTAGSLALAVAAAPAGQESFASAQAAATALATAARMHDETALRAIFGPGGRKMLSSGDQYADREMQRRFAAAYNEKHQLVPEGKGRMRLDVGMDGWPLPIPIVESAGRWHFDTEAGAQEIIDRRIGRNELSALRVCFAYVVAQKAYFDLMKEQTGYGFYAQQLVSSAGKRNGLYWPVATGGTESPFGAMVAEAEQEGYAGAFEGGKRVPYAGYYFRVLTAQGPDSPEGARSYVQGRRMTLGFALLAWPASYSVSGIMSFEVSQDGVVFQKDLGPETARVAAGIKAFDADLSWTRVDVTGE